MNEVTLREPKSTKHFTNGEAFLISLFPSSNLPNNKHLNQDIMVMETLWNRFNI